MINKRKKKCCILTVYEDGRERQTFMVKLVLQNLMHSARFQMG